jgi:plastocyanin
MKHASFALKSTLILAALLGLASCKDQSNPYGTSSTPVPPASPNTVNMANMAFSPKSITVTHGTAVTWKNVDSYAIHTATSDGASWDTGDIAIGASKAVTFAVPGTYAYHCTYHGAMGMTGTVVVQ